MSYKYSVGLWLFGRLADRFATYHPPRDLTGKVLDASKVEGASGVEIGYPFEFGKEEVEKVTSLLHDHHLEVSALILDVYSQPKWIKGSIAALDAGTRREAVQLAKEAMDIARQVGTGTVVLWLGQDGYDYIFQTDYSKAWNWLVDGIREVADHNPNIRLAVEYKPKEPRTHSYIDTVGKGIVLANEIGRKNVGATLDYGHALFAHETPAESLALLNRHHQLFHVHFNDNYRDWDHDMLTASVNFWDALEFYYWLRKVGYSGWITLDIYPYREDVRKACEQSIKNQKLLDALIDKIGTDRLEHCLANGDATEISAILRKVFD